jgi:hypothetical protein
MQLAFLFRTYPTGEHRTEIWDVGHGPGESRALGEVSQTLPKGRRPLRGVSYVDYLILNNSRTIEFMSGFGGGINVCS